MSRRGNRPAKPAEENSSPAAAQEQHQPAPSGAPGGITGGNQNRRPGNRSKNRRHSQGGGASQEQRRQQSGAGQENNRSTGAGAQDNRSRPTGSGPQDNRRQSGNSPADRRRPGSGGPGTGGQDKRRQPASSTDRRKTSSGGQDRRPPSVPRRARGGIRARSENGEFGKNWWAKRWLLAMERLMDGARLARGRRYARIGQVLSMNEANGGVVARVQGSRPAPYRVSIRVLPLEDEQWEKVLDVLADRAIFTAQLLAGEMPANIEEAFSTADVALFPVRGGDLMTECSCPDWANPCKHIAATHYILADRFDEDPFLLFRMRGRTQEQILQSLRQRRAGQEELPPEEPEVSEPIEPLENAIEHYWDIGREMDRFSVNVEPPNVPLPLLVRLGEPDFAIRYPLEQKLGPAYKAMSEAALFLAFSDIGREESDNGSESS